MGSDLVELEGRLDDFDPAVRRDALGRLSRAAGQGRVRLPEAGGRVNLHCHTFFSYNAYGYSPSRFAWLARKAGLAVAGIADFDVLDGLGEFTAAGRLLGLRTCVGMETRVFVPEFAQVEINSPGEPGVCYFMGVGFPSANLARTQTRFLCKLRRTAEARNRALVVRANEHLAPVVLDYDRDVLPLTPAGNATERHLCLAYVKGAGARWKAADETAAFWAEKLGRTRSAIEELGSVEMESLVRSVVMKHGGTAYVRPDSRSFPRVADVGDFIVQAGGIPAYPWLDGTSPAERGIENLLGVMMSSGVSAINIIPDRNYAAGEKNGRLEQMQKLVELAGRLDLPLVVGTEMNSPGQRFVDDFECEELAPFASVFLDGARILYAHSVLQRAAALGYVSDWAKRHFADRRARNQFFCEVGATLVPEQEDSLTGIEETITPESVLSRLRAN